MKRIILLTIIMTMLGLSAHSLNPIAPPFLHAGDTIALLSPSSTPKPGVVEAGVKTLTEWGYHVVVGRHANDAWRSFAGTHEQRLADLLAALRNPSVKAIVCSRGGYGSANVLALLPLDTLRRYPKWIVGYSDITGYLSAAVRAGFMGIHANMCGRLQDTGGTDLASAYLRNLLRGKLPSYRVPAHPLNHQGVASGIVVGGNMCVFGDLAGSPYDFLDPAFTDGRDIILFIEEVGESIARIDRLVQHLRVRGTLDKVKGVIVGRFDDCPLSRGYSSVHEMVEEYLRQYDIPVCYDFPTGHDENWNYPLIEGCPATLRVTGEGVELTFNPR